MSVKHAPTPEKENLVAYGQITMIEALLYEFGHNSYIQEDADLSKTVEKLKQDVYDLSVVLLNRDWPKLCDSLDNADRRGIL